MMGLSIAGSDCTSDFMSEVSDLLKEKMKKQLSEETNEYNTSGYEDVALVLKSLVSDENEFHFTYEWLEDIWGPLRDKLVKNQPSSDWSEYATYKNLQAFVDKMIKKCADY